MLDLRRDTSGTRTVTSIRRNGEPLGHVLINVQALTHDERQQLLLKFAASLRLLSKATHHLSPNLHLQFQNAPE